MEEFYKFSLKKVFFFKTQAILICEGEVSILCVTEESFEW